MENNRETFRKQAMLHFRTTDLIEDNDNLNYRYRTGFRVLICWGYYQKGSGEEG